MRDFHSIGSSHHHQPREVLIREGSPADHVLVVCRGRVKLVAASAEGRLFLLRVAGPGDFLGLAPVLQNARYCTTAETLDTCVIKSIPRDSFLRLMALYPDMGHSIAHALSVEYNSAVLTARRLALHTSAAGKLASTLLDLALADPLGSKPARPNLPISFPMQLTHEDLGSMAGLSRETVSRLLTRFRREGQVHQILNRMTIAHPEQLKTRYC